MSKKKVLSCPRRFYPSSIYSICSLIQYISPPFIELFQYTSVSVLVGEKQGCARATIYNKKPKTKQNKAQCWSQHGRNNVCLACCCRWFSPLTCFIMKWNTTENHPESQTSGIENYRQQKHSPVAGPFPRAVKV